MLIRLLREGRYEDLDQFLNGFSSLIRYWLDVAERRAIPWIEDCEKKRYIVYNRQRFMECVAAATAATQNESNQDLTLKQQKSLENAVQEIRNGATEQFISE